MLNIFVNSTTFGQAMGATFKMDAVGTLSDKRVTPLNLCNVVAPVYGRVMNAEKVTALINSGQSSKVSNFAKAIETEKIRVNSLNMLVRELSMINAMEDCNEMITAYVPAPLLSELESGRVKVYLFDESVETTYYSKFELELWKNANALIQQLYCRLIFKKIDSCKVNVSNTPIQAERVDIYNSIYEKILVAFREEKTRQAASQYTETASTGTNGSAFY